jgi:O-antigen ligase
MFNFIRVLYAPESQYKLQLFANHLLVLIAFFLPINKGTVGSGFFILLVLLLLKKDLFHDLKNALKNRVILSLIAFWLLHFIGILYSDDPSHSKLYAYDMNFILYSILIFIFAQYKFLFRILSAFLVGVFVSELLSYGFIFEILTSPMPPFLNMSPIANKYEPSPFTFHAEYGFILAIGSAFILQKLLTHSTKTEKIILSLFFTTITLNIFFNSARTGYILFFLSNGSILLFHYKRYIISKLHFLIPSLFVILFAAWSLSDNLKREYHETIASIDAMYHNSDFSSSLGIRIHFIMMGMDALKESNPLIGFGTDMHGLAVYTEASKRNDTMTMNYLLHTGQYTGKIYFIDCEYNSILLQFGFVGLLIYLNLFYQIFRFHNQNSDLHIIKNSLVVSSLFYAFVSSIFSGYLVPMIFVFLISLTLIQKEKVNPPLPQIKTKSFLLYALSIILLFIISKVT